MWGIPFYLFTPFMSVYMAAMLVTDQQIGLIASVLMSVRAISAFFGGAITDKLGRKKATFIFDALSWSVPTLIWIFSQNFWWFIAAAAFNGLSEVAANSWNCLLIEDAPRTALVDIYAWVHISQLLAVFFAPLAGLLVGEVGLVPAVRVVFILSFISITLKVFILNHYCDETKAGKRRLEETRGASLSALISGYGQIARKLFTSPRMVLALSIATFVVVTGLVTQTFFGLYATRTLAMPEHFLAFFPIIRAGIMLAFLFIIQPRIAGVGLKGPLVAGVILYMSAYSLLITIPAQRLGLLLLCLFLESCAHGLVLPRRDSIQALFVDPGERARLNSVLAVVVFTVTIPFGSLSGWMSAIDGRLPFLMIVVIFVIQLVVVASSRTLSTDNVRALERAQSDFLEDESR